MEFLKYSNEKHVNVIPKEEFSSLSQEVFNTIAFNLAKSLGPLGSSTTVFDGLYTSATKDGYSILKSMKFHNRYKNMIYNLIKVPCTKLNNQVGDGTTSVVVLTDLLFRKYQEGKNIIDTYYRLPRSFINTWDSVIQSTIDKINHYATPLDSSDYDKIYNLSYVASNGNHEISKNIADTYQAIPSPSIKLKNSPTNKSYITPIIGFEFPTNLIDEGYARNEDLSVELKDIAVMLLDHKIESDFCQNVIIPINEALKAKGMKLLIIAPSYDALLVSTTLHKYMNIEYQKYRELNLILTQYVMGKLDENQLNDLAIILRANVVTQDVAKSLEDVVTQLSDGSRYELVEEIMDDPTSEYFRLIGRCDSVLTSCTNGSIFRAKDIEMEERYQDALRVAEKELNDIKSNTEYEKQSFAYDIAKIQTRITQLKMKNFIYYIGADSALQSNIIYDSVEDVVKAVQSAIRSGTIPGCQLSIIRACYEQIEEISKTETITDELKLRQAILEIILNATFNLYNIVLMGPERSGILKTIPRWQFTTTEGEAELIKEEEKKRWGIINESIKRNQVYDLETLEYNDKIITSCETDTSILIAAGELIKLLISGNQCIFLDAEVNDNHNETIEAYV